MLEFNLLLETKRRAQQWCASEQRRLKYDGLHTDFHCKQCLVLAVSFPSPAISGKRNLWFHSSSCVSFWVKLVLSAISQKCSFIRGCYFIQNWYFGNYLILIIQYRSFIFHYCHVMSYLFTKRHILKLLFPSRPHNLLFCWFHLPFYLLLWRESQLVS